MQIPQTVTLDARLGQGQWRARHRDRSASDSGALKSIPPDQLLTAIHQWFEKIAEFHQGEDEFLILQEPTLADLRFHRAFLVNLLNYGEQLAMLSWVGEIPTNTDGITAATIEAELDGLYATLYGWHSGMNKERRLHIIQSVFGDVPQPKA